MYNLTYFNCHYEFHVYYGKLIGQSDYWLFVESLEFENINEFL